MQYVLTVLNFIWITLLILLAVLLTIVLLLLFFPVSYRIKGKKCDEEAKVKFCISWLLGIVRVKGIYDNEHGTNVAGYVLFFNLLKDKNKSKAKVKTVKKEKVSIKKDGATKVGEKQVDKKCAKKTLGDFVSDGEFDDDVTKAVVISKRELPIEKAVNAESPIKTITEDAKRPVEVVVKANSDTNENNKEKNKEKKNAKLNKEAESGSKAKSLSEKLKGIFTKLKEAKSLLVQERIQVAIKLVLSSVKRLLVSILPRKLKVKGCLGFEDPSSTGKALVLYSIAYPFVGKNIKVNFAFDKQVIELDGYAKGRFTMFRLLMIGLKIYFDRNFKYLLKHVM